MSSILLSSCVFALEFLRVEVSGFVPPCRWTVKRATSPSAQGRHEVAAGAGERSSWALRGDGTREENSNRYEIDERCSRGDLLHSVRHCFALLYDLLMNRWLVHAFMIRPLVAVCS